MSSCDSVKHTLGNSNNKGRKQSNEFLLIIIWIGISLARLGFVMYDNKELFISLCLLETRESKNIIDQKVQEWLRVGKYNWGLT